MQTPEQLKEAVKNCRNTMMSYTFLSSAQVRSQLEFGIYPNSNCFFPPKHGNRLSAQHYSC